MRNWFCGIFILALISATIILLRPWGATEALAATPTPVGGGTTPPANAPSVSQKRFYRFHPDETIYGLLRRHNFNESQIQVILRQNLLPKGFSLSHGESYRLGVSKDNRFIEVRAFEPTKNLAYVFWRFNQSSGSYVREEDYQVKNRRIEGRINGSLLTSILAKLPNKWAAHRFMDAYSLDFNVPKTLQRGAYFAMVIETKWDGTDMIGYGELLETELEINNERERRYFVGFPGGGSFINPANLHPERPLYSPVNYMRLSSLFETRRFHPIKHRKQPHLGIDFEIHQGEDVFSAEAGVVEAAGFRRAAGNYVVIRHKSGLVSYYNHMLRLAPGVTLGANVINGQKIGEVGCTGYCTKAHLHFALKSNGKWVDPVRYIKSYPFRSQSLISHEGEALRHGSNL